MQFFGNLSIAKRLYLLNIVAAIGLITLSAITIYETTNGLKAQSNAELKHLTRMALSVVESYQTRAQSGEISEDQAKKGAMAAISKMRYSGDGYFWISDMTSRMIMHPTNPGMNGKDVSGTKDPNGKMFFAEFIKIVGANGSGFVDYYWPKPGSADPVHKQTYVIGFNPWSWIIGTGVYTDKLDAVI